MDDRRVGRQLCRGPGLTVSGDRTIDQLRIELMQRAVVQLQSAHHPRSKIFDEDIATCDKPADNFDCVRRFQIENEALLADIELAEGGREAVADRRTGSHRLAFGGLYLDDLRTHVGKHPRAVWAGNRGREIEYTKTLKALCQNPLIVWRYRHFRKLPSAAARP